MTINPRLLAVHESVQVDCPVEEAFWLYTTGMGELHVGNVVACEPPWRITFIWTTADWEGETEVEVTFTPQDEGTRVDLSHRGFDRHGPLGTDVAAKFRGDWPGVMHAFVHKLCRSGRPRRRDGRPGSLISSAWQSATLAVRPRRPGPIPT
jgi:Activator of Hsp90 ATPase homolog 1-like protein